MTRELADYFIESQKHILLHFKDGTSKRVHIKNLEETVSQIDFENISRALSVHKGFTDNVLPPWLKVVLLATLAFGVVSGTSRVAGITQREDYQIKRLEPTATSKEAVSAVAQPKDLMLEQAVEVAKQAVEPLISEVQPKTEFVKQHRSDKGNEHARDQKSQRDKSKEKDNHGKPGKSDKN